MDDLQVLASQFLVSSAGIPVEAEQLFQKLYENIEKRFAHVEQKTKKAKQAEQELVDRDTAAKTSKAVADKENQQPADNIDPSSLLDDTTASQRPQRTRKTKLTTLRESILSGEVKVKKEPKDKPVKAKRIEAEAAAPEKRKSADDTIEANVSTESNKKLDSSVEVISKKTSFVEVSDDESEKMPPPALPVLPKTRKTRAKKPSSVSALQVQLASVRIKEEPVNEPIQRPKRSKAVYRTNQAPVKEPINTTTVTTTSAAKPLEEADPTYGKLTPKVRMSSMENLSQVSVESSASSSQPSQTNRTETAGKSKSAPKTKGGRTKKVVAPKAEAIAVAVPKEAAASEEVTVPGKELLEEQPANNKKTKKVSGDSVYEDAQNDPKLFRSSIRLDQVTSKNEPEPQKSAAPQEEQEQPMELGIEATTTAAAAAEADEPQVPNVNNETFITAVPPTPAVAPLNALSTPVPVQLDSTFNVVEIKKSPAAQHDSIMTEDMSVVLPAAADEKKFMPEPEEVIVPSKAPVMTAAQKKQMASTKKKPYPAHEIFNPFVQSPVKAKVDAYEKHVKESKIPVTPKYVPKGLMAALSQPLPTRSNLLADNHQQRTTPSSKTTNHLQATASDLTGNKLAHMKKVLGKGGLLAVGSSDSARGSTASSSAASSSASAKSRSNSVEDSKRGGGGSVASNILLLAEEKKKKREEKQRLAQQNREKLEREKKEQMERLAREREEKAKKFLQEKAEQARQEKKKQAIVRLAMENSQQLKIKEMMQKQKATYPDTNGYGWELLKSGDSTDDEEKATKLPEAPEWSRRPHRSRLMNEQSPIHSKIIDRMFGLKPMSPDLREIFPDIDPKLLKRNSSMIWKTPPRMSRVERP